MSTIYVAREGITIPDGWPVDGRPINPLSPLERRYVRDRDLVPLTKPAAKAVMQKDNTHGK